MALTLNSKPLLGLGFRGSLKPSLQVTTTGAVGVKGCSFVDPSSDSRKDLHGTFGA